ncbi:MAG: UbiA family prenyltransferase [Propylenella sp.]
MTFADAVRLGRVSNLPTVWTNALAGQALAGALLPPAPLALLLIAVSLAYVGGMYLNDAFDAEIDAKERPERPIPSGRVSRATVFACGYAMLAASVLGLGLTGWWTGNGLRAGAAGLALALLIVLYNRRHKENPLSPVVMGLCRVFVYVAAALCVTDDPPAALWVGAALLLCHLIGLTYLAKQETLGRVTNLWPLLFLAAPIVYGMAFIASEQMAAFFWLALLAATVAALFFAMRRRPGDIPRSVMTLIAAISLLDALLIAGQAMAGLALAAALGFPATLAGQRFVRGT